MNNRQTNYKLIAKNTLMLYVRMFLVMGVSLFTTRIILQNLGEKDYGINNVVGGIVAMFGFLNSSMVASTQRFLSFELGRNDRDSVRNVFCQAVVIHWIIAFIVFLLAETLGLWLLYTQLNIPADRFSAALWVYQFAILSFLINIIQVPYSASVIAHEKMQVYAWLSILSVFASLTVAYLLSVVTVDKLKFLAVFGCATTFVFCLFYKFYTHHRFEECRFRMPSGRGKMIEMFSFAGWNMIGNLAYVLRMQGSNILLNIFFGPAVNAARGVAHHVDGAVERFVSNFMVASNPQIIKTYAAGEYHETLKLLCRCSKFSFYLVLLLGIPLILQADYILSLWLVKVPAYTTVFVQLLLLNGVIDSVSKPIKTYVKATGKVKWYMILQGGFYLMALPVIYLLLWWGYSPVSSIIVLVVFTFLGTFLRLVLAQQVGESFSIRYFVSQVLEIVLLVGLVAYVGSVCIDTLLPSGNIGLFILRTVLMLISTALTIWLIGLTSYERESIQAIVKKTFKR